MYTRSLLNTLRKKLILSGYESIMVESLLDFLKSLSCKKPDPSFTNFNLLQKLCAYSNENSIVPVFK